MNHAATFERISVGDPHNSLGLHERPGMRSTTCAPPSRKEPQ